MGKEDYTPQSYEQETSSTTSTSYSRWIAEQLAILEMAKDVKIDKRRLQMYVVDLVDLPRERLAEAFVRARRELVYFPQIAELRNFAGAAKQLESVDAMAAWEEANRYARKYGVDQLPEYVRGQGLVPPPPLPPRIEYALRRIGGLKALRSIEEASFPFMLRDFCTAYNEAPMAERTNLLPAQKALPEPADGLQITLAEIKAKLGEAVAKMPQPKARKFQPVNVRQVPPAIQLTKEQIEARRPAEREEIKRYQQRTKR